MDSLLSDAFASITINENDATVPSPQLLSNNNAISVPNISTDSCYASERRIQLAGLDAPLEALRELILWPVKYIAEGASLGISWPRGVLLHGPPGCGKTALVKQVAQEAGASLHIVTAATVFAAYVGESERQLREAFEAATADARNGRPTLIFLDEVDALCPKRSGHHQHESRVVAQLLTLLDGASSLTPSSKFLSSSLQMSDPCSKSSAGHVVVIAATNRPNAVDPALRRPGRLDREVLVPVPNAIARAAILQVHSANIPLSPEVDLKTIATKCFGYSGADLAALAREAALHGLTRSLPLSSNEKAVALETSSMAKITAEDFAAALRRVGPSIVRGAAVEVEPTSWEDVGGLHNVKRRLKQAVEWPLKHSAAFARLGLTPTRGVLLYGPPGCSKTSLARAAAWCSGATLLPLSCATLYSAYVGEGETGLRQTFAAARLATPAIVFLDEIDAIAGKREEGSASGDSGGVDASTRLLSTLLTEMDGLESAGGVLVLAATNAPWALDSALTRPGRLDVTLLVPPPDLKGREQIFRLHTKHMPLGEDVDLEGLARSTDGFSGADVAGLCREAALTALREDPEGARAVLARHFALSLACMGPSISQSMLALYEAWGSRGMAKT